MQEQTYEEKIYLKIYNEINLWQPVEGYALSFFLDFNQVDENKPHLFISYNTEADCEYADAASEKRWNYAFWAQRVNPIINSDAEINECIKWLNSQGVNNVGAEGNNITEPAGYKELAELLSLIAKKIRKSGLLKKVFGYDVPILVHGLEYSEFTFSLARKTNPKKLIKDFLQYFTNFSFAEYSALLKDSDFSLETISSFLMSQTGEESLNLSALSETFKDPRLKNYAEKDPFFTDFPFETISAFWEKQAGAESLDIDFLSEILKDKIQQTIEQIKTDCVQDDNIAFDEDAKPDDVLNIKFIDNDKES